MIVSFILKDIQKIMKYFSSVFGFFLMILFPCVLIAYTRNKVAKHEVTPGKINRSIFDKNSNVYGVCLVGALIFGLIIYGFFHNLNKTCVAG